MNSKGGKIAMSICLLMLIRMPVVFAFPSTAQSFTDGHTARFLNIDNGLPSNFVDDIYRDSDGFMWISLSGGGLCRYDGYSLLPFSTNSTPSLKNNFIRNVVEDRFHRLWIASEGGIDVLDLDSYTMLPLAGTGLDEYSADGCSHVEIDADGCIWAGLSGRLARIPFSPDGTMDKVDCFNDDRLSSLNQYFEDVDADGSVWTSLQGIINKVVPTVDGMFKLQPVMGGISLRPDAVVTDFLNREGEVWMSTNEGLFRFSLNSGNWKRYVNSPLDVTSLSQNYISGLSISDKSEMLAISLKGLNIYDPINDCFSHIYAADENNGGSALLSSDFINCINVSAGSIWLGTESAGLVQIQDKNLAVGNYVHSWQDMRSIQPNPVNAIFEDVQGEIWIGNVESGLCHTSNPGSGFDRVDWKRVGLSHGSISSIITDGRGRLWVGTWGGGVNVERSHRPSMSFERVVWNSANDERFNYVGTMAYDSINGLVWIGTNYGIFHVDENTLEAGALLTGNMIMGFAGSAIDTDGQLWMGSQHGVYVIDLKSGAGAGGQFSYRNYKYKLDAPQSATMEKIVAITLAHDGTVWLGSNGNGIYRAGYDSDGNLTFLNFNVRNGLVNDFVKCILEDSYGRLWISTANGLSRMDTVQHTFRNYSKRDGLESNQFYWNAACRLADGRLCFGTIGGLTVIDPAKCTDMKVQAELHFTGIETGGKQRYAAGDGPLRLHENDRGLEFSFSPLTFGNMDAVRYSYRLKGMDNEWTAVAASRNSIGYSALPPGNYTLEVRAMDESGQVLDNCAIDIKVVPRPVHTWWFKLFLLLACASVLLLFFYKRSKALVRQKQTLQALVDERTREIIRQKKLIEQKADELDSQNSLLRRQMEELVSSRLIIAQDIQTSDTPEKDVFKTKVLDVMRDNYKNPDLDVNAVCEAMGMSKTLLNKRLQETMGQSIVGLVSSYRLSMAHEMLLSNKGTKKLNISEVAYEVGFNDPKYFTRCFVKKYGISPSGV